MTLATVLVFTATTALTCFTPGPAALFVASCAASNGKRHIPACIAGIAAANLLYFFAAAMGVAGIILASPTLFFALKLIGALYLAWLGIRLLCSRTTALGQIARQQDAQTLRRSFFKAFLVELSNPKAILYFSALLPQFVEASEPLPMQFALFSAITVLLDIAAYSFYGVLGTLSAKASGGGILSGITRGAGVLFLLTSIRIAFGH